MKSKIIWGFIFSTLLFISCNHSQEVRKPISHSSGSFMKKSIERNKKLVANEEDEIQNVIKSNPKTNYISSNKGFWYTYIKRNLQDTIPPKKGDVAFFDYEIKDIYGKVIYSQAELRPQVYFVDKQDILIGLREGIKIMHRGEKINFLFPSHKVYGYHGDTKKVGTNVPLLITVTLNNYKPEDVYKKEKSNQQAANEAIIKNGLEKPTTPVAKKPQPTAAPVKTAQTIKPNLTVKPVIGTKPTIINKATPTQPVPTAKPITAPKPAVVAKPVTEKPEEIIKPTTTNQPKDSL